MIGDIIALNFPTDLVQLLLFPSPSINHTSASSSSIPLHLNSRFSLVPISCAASFPPSCAHTHTHHVVFETITISEPSSSNCPSLTSD